MNNMNNQKKSNPNNDNIYIPILTSTPSATATSKFVTEFRDSAHSCYGKYPLKFKYLTRKSKVLDGD